MRTLGFIVAAILFFAAGCSTYTTSYRSPDGRVVMEATGHTGADGVATVMNGLGELSVRVEHPQRREKEIEAASRGIAPYLYGGSRFADLPYETRHQIIWGYPPR